MPEPETNKALLADVLRLTEDSDEARFISGQLNAGHFNEYDGPLAAPIFALVQALRTAGLDEYARRVMEGEFDD